MVLVSSRYALRLPELVHCPIPIEMYPLHRPVKCPILFATNRLILLTPRHTLRCLRNNSPTPLQRGIKLRFPFHRLLASPPFLFLQHEPPRCSIFIGTVEFPFDARKVIVIVVDSLWRCEVGPLHVLCRVSDAVALGPLFVALDAGEGAGKGEAARTAVFVGMDVAYGA